METTEMQKAHHFLFLALAGCLCGCYLPQAESALIRNFRAHRPAFEELLKLAAGDPDHPRISGGQVPPVGMRPERFALYKELFRKLNIDSGLTRYSAYPGAVFLIVVRT